MNDPMRDPIPFAGCFAADPGESKGATPLAFVGLPCDSQSTFRRGTAEGPARIVAAYELLIYILDELAHRVGWFRNIIPLYQRLGFPQ